MHAQIPDYDQYVKKLHTNSFLQNNSMDLSTIKQFCHEQVQKLHFDYVSYVGYFPMLEEMHEISTFPDVWTKANNRLYDTSSNPISMLGRYRTTAFLWQDSQSDSNFDNHQLRDFLVSAQMNGIHNGVCFPIHGAGAEWGVLNIARSQKLNNASLESIQSMQLYAMTIHEAVKRATACRDKYEEKRNILSPRECECLNWIAAGKTAWETAKIIGVTESTVSFHVRNTISKLNARNRAQAVAVAMARSLIDNPNKHHA